MTIALNPAKLIKRAGALAGLVLLAGCAVPQQMAAAPPGPVAPGAARIWFYRVYDPSLSRNLANVDLNGARAASVAPSGPPVFVDVAPGPYHISPESFGQDTNQTRDVTLAAGQTVYIKILDDPTLMSSGDRTEFRRDTFYAWLMPPQVALAEMRM
ncbi:MAG TPA: hypothetical protein VG308_15480 [Stellaceae bacterium]|jgi:hypothetical protein|nr:hypothetical protein [Stellaceae bacterium]